MNTFKKMFVVSFLFVTGCTQAANNSGSFAKLVLEHFPEVLPGMLVRTQQFAADVVPLLRPVGEHGKLLAGDVRKVVVDVQQTLQNQAANIDKNVTNSLKVRDLIPESQSIHGYGPSEAQLAQDAQLAKKFLLGRVVKPFQLVFSNAAVAGKNSGKQFAQLIDEHGLKIAGAVAAIAGVANVAEQLVEKQDKLDKQAQWLANVRNDKAAREAKIAADIAQAQMLVEAAQQAVVVNREYAARPDEIAYAKQCELDAQQQLAQAKLVALSYKHSKGLVSQETVEAQQAISHDIARQEVQYGDDERLADLQRHIWNNDHTWNNDIERLKSVPGVALAGAKDAIKFTVNTATKVKKFNDEVIYPFLNTSVAVIGDVTGVALAGAKDAIHHTVNTATKLKQSYDTVIDPLLNKEITMPHAATNVQKVGKDLFGSANKINIPSCSSILSSVKPSPFDTSKMHGISESAKQEREKNERAAEVQKNEVQKNKDLIQRVAHSVELQRAHAKKVQEFRKQQILEKKAQIRKYENAKRVEAEELVKRAEEQRAVEKVQEEIVAMAGKLPIQEGIVSDFTQIAKKIDNGDFANIDWNCVTDSAAVDWNSDVI
jgi:hypothetical protein